MKILPAVIRENKFLYHLTFSAGVLCCLLLGMGLLYLSGFRFHSLPSALTDCLFFLLCTYTGRWLAMSYVKQKAFLFMGKSLLAVIMLSMLKFALIKYVFGHLYAGLLEVVRDAMPFFLVGVLAGILLKLIKHFLEKELLDAKLQTEQKTMALNLLQSQLSPHFLFNVLNNLYGIALAEPQRVPALLLRLSDLLRYSVYGGKKQWVPLQEELDYIRTYIEFERIRLSDRLVLEMELPVSADPSIKIAPSVLIVFIENAFKHARNTLTKKIVVRLSLQLSGGFILFDVANSFIHEENKDTVTDESSGLGLDNTLKRLALLYGQDYALKQYAENDYYYVSLKLRIQQEEK